MYPPKLVPSYFEHHVETWTYARVALYKKEILVEWMPMNEHSDKDCSNEREQLWICCLLTLVYVLGLSR